MQMQAYIHRLIVKNPNLTPFLSVSHPNVNLTSFIHLFVGLTPILR